MSPTGPEAQPTDTPSAAPDQSGLPPAFTGAAWGPTLPPAGPVVVTRWPVWPAWLATVIGGVVGFTGFVMLGMAEAGARPLANPTVLGVAAVGGALAVIGGLSYQAARSIVARRSLPPNLYRGPSIILLLVLATVIATLASIPFFDELALMLSGESQPSPLATLVLLASNQAALLLVSWLFVVMPRALPGLPPLGGGRPAYVAAGVGLGFGILAWIGAMVVGAIVALLLERLGLPLQPGPAEQALELLDPLIVVPAVVVLAPVAEEVFFRGVMLNAWSRQYGERRALIGSSLVFAVIHLSLAALVPIFLLGVALAFVYRRTGSLLAAIVMHATVNGISTAIALLVRADVISLPV